MNKLTQPVPDDGEDFGPELSDADVDAWIDRNRDALKVALQEAREQIARGEVSELDMEDIIARGRARFEASKKRV
jgi:antitoxin ParD1/3/4